MNKRAQVTIFIILAIVVVAGVGIYFAVSGNLNKSKSSSLDTRQIESFVQSCIEEVGEDAIYEIGQNGGYVFAPELSTFSGIPYYFINETNYMPSKEKVEESLSNYIEQSLFLCLNDFENFLEYNISQEEVFCETIFEEDFIKLNVKVPLTISKGNEVKKIEDFENIDVYSSFGKSFFAIGKIVQTFEEKNKICLTCISDILEETNLRMDINSDFEGGLLFSIIDKNYEIKNHPFEYVFAVKLENEEE